MNTLSILCFGRYSKMLLALDHLKDPSAVIEVGTTHRDSYVIVYGGDVSKEVKELAVDVLVISSPHEGLLPAYFKQKAVRVDKSVVCVEAEKLSTIFQTTNTILSKTNYQCIEINRSMSDSGYAVALFANGTDITALKAATTEQVTEIKAPGATFKKFF